MEPVQPRRQGASLDQLCSAAACEDGSADADDGAASPAAPAAAPATAMPGGAAEIRVLEVDAFASVPDLIQSAIASKGSAASLRDIYEACHGSGRIAYKRAGGSRLITANDHWKSQIRHALYTGERFQRSPANNDLWQLTKAHASTSPQLVKVLVRAEEVAEAAAAAAAAALGRGGRSSAGAATTGRAKPPAAARGGAKRSRPTRKAATPGAADATGDGDASAVSAATSPAQQARASQLATPSPAPGAPAGGPTSSARAADNGSLLQVGCWQEPAALGAARRREQQQEEEEEEDGEDEVVGRLHSQRPGALAQAVRSGARPGGAHGAGAAGAAAPAPSARALHGRFEAAAAGMAAGASAGGESPVTVRVRGGRGPCMQLHEAPPPRAASRCSEEPSALHWGSTALRSTIVIAADSLLTGSPRSLSGDWLPASLLAAARRRLRQDGGGGGGGGGRVGSAEAESPPFRSLAATAGRGAAPDDASELELEPSPKRLASRLRRYLWLRWPPAARRCLADALARLTAAAAAAAAAGMVPGAAMPAAAGALPFPGMLPLVSPGAAMMLAPFLAPPATPEVHQQMQALLQQMAAGPMAGALPAGGQPPPSQGT
eukprot:scaffold12.g8122.t1